MARIMRAASVFAVSSLNGVAITGIPIDLARQKSPEILSETGEKQKMDQNELPQGKRTGSSAWSSPTCVRFGRSRAAHPHPLDHRSGPHSAAPPPTSPGRHIR